jgi:hypothetical protein
MKPSRAARIAAVILALAGLASMAAAGIVATRDFTVVAGPKHQHFKCGSVLFPKDPRNRVSKRATVPLKLRQAESRCQATSSDRTHTATTFLVIGVIPLLIVLMLPALTRRSRRARAHRRLRI